MSAGAILHIRFFGEFSRYHLTKQLNRFGEMIYFVQDANKIDELTGLPEIIRQGNSESEVVKDL